MYLTLDKLNEPKIKNFSEVEAYVVLSCPSSSFYDYKDFYKACIRLISDSPHAIRTRTCTRGVRVGLQHILRQRDQMQRGQVSRRPKERTRSGEELSGRQHVGLHMTQKQESRRSPQVCVADLRSLRAAKLPGPRYGPAGACAEGDAGQSRHSYGL